MKVCVVTSTRADFGLLKGLMGRIKDSDKLELQVVATGAHLLESFGNTARDIVSAGFTIDWEVSELTAAISGSDVAEQVGRGIPSFSRGYEALAPDVVVLLGDRYEILSAAIAAFFRDIPIMHLHGGEVTHGAFDDAIRHSISKFARVHGVAAEEYAERIIRAGEPPDSVHVVGGLGVDEILRTELLSRETIEKDLDLSLGNEVFVVTYHPITAGDHDSEREIASIIAALDNFPEATVIFTLPGADPEHQVIRDRITQAVEARKPDWHLFASLGQQMYLSLVAIASAVVGNSSSGLLEAPTLMTATVNIGDRQKGRLIAESVVQADPTVASTSQALKRALSADFRATLTKTASPYGSGGAVNRVMQVLEEIDFSRLGPKLYYDPVSSKKVESHGQQ